MPVGDEDCDGFATDRENYLGTDPLDACPDDPSDDAWPPDVHGGQGCRSHDGHVSILDVLCYKPVLAGPYDRRYDLDADGTVNIMDVLAYKSLLGASCIGT